MEYAGSPFDIKTLDDTGHIEGFLAGFDNVDHGGDKLIFGSLTKTLASRGNAPLPMLHSHNMARPIGAWKSWEERPEGLFVKGKLTLSTRDAQEAHALAKDGALTGLSIGWTLKKAVNGNDGTRIVQEAELHEGSLVAVPMNPKTRVTAIKSITNARDIAELLQEAGVSGRRAKAAAGAAWKAINEQSDDAAAEAQIVRLFEQHSARLAAIGGY